MAIPVFKSQSVALSTTNRTTIYTTPSLSRAVITSIIIANVDASSATTVKLEFFDASASTHFALTGAKSIATNDFLVISDSPIYFDTGDILSATAGAADDITVTAFVEEYSTGF
tara:strand:- start:4329 stop:4670 length:342 start_codon:yes stop_codon:yes gene_type:complete